MSELGGEAIIELRGDDRALMGDIDGAGRKSGKRFSAGFGSAVKGIGALVAGAAVVGFLKGSIAEAREAQKVGAVSAQIIKATGGAANVSAKQLGALTSRISAKAGVDDEAIQSGANLLLTFKNVRNEVGKGNQIFDRATQAAVDLSAAGFGSIEGGSKMLGKALNDPVKGISALSRAGVTFTEQQKEQIGTLVKNGQSLKAQKIILKEVESQVGGVAAASATGGEKMKVAFGNLQETVGTVLLPLLDRAEAGLASLANFVSANLGPALSRISTFLAPVKAAIAGLFAGGGGGGASAFLGIITGLATSITTQVLPVLQTLGGMFLTTILPAILGVAQSVQTNFLPVLSMLATTFTTLILPAVLSFVTYLVTSLLPIFTTVYGIIATQVIPIIASLATFFIGTLVPAVMAIVTSVAGSLKPVFDQLVATFIGSVLPTVQLVLAKFRQWQPTIQAVIVVVVRIIGFMLRLAAAILGRVLPPLIRFAAFMIGTVVRVVVAVIGVVVRIIAVIIRFGSAMIEGGRKVMRFADAVDHGIRSALKFIGGIPGKAKSALGNLGGILKAKGEELIGGLIKGIEAKFKAVKAAIGKVTGFIKDHLPGSPIKTGPLVSWNNGGAGKRLIEQGLISGFDAKGPALEAAMARTAARATSGLQGGWTPPATVLAATRPTGGPAAPTAAAAGGGGETHFHAHLPTGDPEAAAEAMWTRWLLADAGGQ